MSIKKEPKTYIFTEKVLSQIHETIGSRIPETGGICIHLSIVPAADQE